MKSNVQWTCGPRLDYEKAISLQTGSHAAIKFERIKFFNRLACVRSGQIRVDDIELSVSLRHIFSGIFNNELKLPVFKRPFMPLLKIFFTESHYFSIDIDHGHMAH